VAWQRASVRAALRGLRLSLGRQLGLVLSFLAGCRLLDFFEAQQQLILGKRFYPPSEAMTLHLLDDLFEPLGAGALCQQHLSTMLSDHSKPDGEMHTADSQNCSPGERWERNSAYSKARMCRQLGMNAQGWDAAE
jgi:hypothetical protein